MTPTTLQGTTTPVQSNTYERLAAQFDYTFSDVRGGVTLRYINGEQVISRLNEVLGFDWDFRVVSHGLREDADEYWVLGELTALIDGRTIVRQQFGSDKVQRSRSTGIPLDIGFDLKSAATDCLKKCATLFGVGLYLSAKDEPQAAARRPPTPISGSRPAEPPRTQGPPRILCQQPTGVVDTGGKHELCGKLLEAVPARGWTIPQLANEGVGLVKRPMCLEHYEEQERRQAS